MKKSTVKDENTIPINIWGKIGYSTHLRNANQNSTGILFYSSQKGSHS